MTTLSPAERAVMRRMGSIGGTNSARNMTPQQRRARAVKASKAAALAKKKKQAIDAPKR